VSALHGLGGIGKSTLAIALAREPAIQQRFSDGVLWATLGQQPDLLSHLSHWIQALGDHDFRPTSEAAASGHLRSLLHRKSALLVVDDAWRTEHVSPFLTGGPSCRALLTTRRADIADEVGARLFHLDILQPDRALALLAACLGRPLSSGEEGEALAMAAAVGFSPLALELAAARVRRGASWKSLQEALDQEVARLEELEGARRRRGAHTRLEASLNLSLQALREEDESAWRSFVVLGVMPEDAILAAPLAANLWQASEGEAQELLELLWSDALLLPGPRLQIGESSHPGYRLHDLLHDVARRRLVAPAPGGLGLTLPEAHAALLDRYRVRCSDGLWQNLLDDGYVHTHLAWHLEKAGQRDGLHTLLCEETASGENAWSAVRQRLGQTAGYLADVSRAWRLAEEYMEEDPAVALGCQCLYAGIIASFVSIASSIPPELMAALLRTGEWTPSQALAYAGQALPGSRPSHLSLLIPLFPEALLPEALTQARRLKDDSARAEVLRALQPRLTDDLADAALDLAQRMADGPEKTVVFIPLLASLPDRLVTAGLEMLVESRDAPLRRLGISHLLPRVLAPLPTGIVALLESEKDEALRASSLLKLRRGFSGEEQAGLLEVALKIQKGPWRAAALLALLLPPLQPGLDGEISLLPKLLMSLHPHLAARVRRALEELDPLSQVAGNLALALPGMYERLTIRALAEEKLPAELLVPSAVSLVDPVLARRLLRDFSDSSLRTCVAMLCANDADLAGEVLADLRSALIRSNEAPSRVREVDIERRLEEFRLSRQWEGFVELVPALPLAYLESALEMANSVLRKPGRYPPPRSIRINLLRSAEVSFWDWDEADSEEELFGPAMAVLPQPVLAAVLALREEQQRAELLNLIGFRVPKALLEQASHASAKRGVTERSAALAPLASHWCEVLPTLASLDDPELLATVLSAIVPGLPEGMRLDALRLGLHLPAKPLRAFVEECLPWLPAEDLPTALELAAGKTWEPEALLGILPRLPKSSAPALLERVLRLEHSETRIRALSVLLPSLPPRTARRIIFENSQGQGAPHALALLKLSSHLRSDPLAEIMDRVLSGILELPYADRVVLLEEAATVLARGAVGSILPDRDFRLWEAAFRVLETALPRSEQLRTLQKMLPSLPPRLVSRALALAAYLPNGKKRAQGLAAVASRLRDAPDVPVTDLLGAVWTLPSERLQTEVLEALSRFSSLEVLGQALKVLGERPEKRGFLRTLLRTADGLAGEAAREGLREILSLSTRIGDADRAAVILGWLGSHVREQGERILLDSLTTLDQVPDERLRAGLLARIGRWLPEELSDSFLNTALDQLRSCPWGSEHVQALSWLARFRPFDVLAEAERTKGAVRCALLSAVAQHVPLSGWDAILAAVRSIEERLERLNALSGVLPSLPSERLGDVLDLANELGDARLRARALALLAPRWPSGELSALLQASQALPAETRLLVMHALASRTDLPLETLVEEALALDRPELWLKTLGPTFESLPPRLWPRALAACQRLPAVREREMVLVCLATSFEGAFEDEDFEALLDQAAGLEDSALQVSLLKSFRGRLPDWAQVRLWRQSLSALAGSADAPAVAFPLWPIAPPEMQSELRRLAGDPEEPEFILDEDLPPECGAPGEARPEPPPVERLALDAREHVFIIHVVEAARTARRYQGDEEGARRLLELARSIDPRHPQVAWLTGWLAVPMRESPEPALPLPQMPEAPPQQVVSNGPLSAARRWVALGDEAFRTDRYRAALDAWKRALQEDMSDREALARFRRVRVVIEAGRMHLRLLLGHALERLEAGDNRAAIFLWLDALALDVDPGPEAPLLEEATRRVGEACETWVLGLLAEAQFHLDEGQAEEALDRVAEVLRIDPERSEARRLVQEAQSRLDQDLQARIRELLEVIRRAVWEHTPEPALKPLVELLSLDPHNREARRLSLKLHNLRSNERWRQIQRELTDRLREARASGDLGVILDTCAVVCEISANHQEAGWILRLVRGFENEDYSPVLLPWPVAGAPSDPRLEILLPVLSSLAHEQFNFEGASVLTLGLAKLDQGDLNGAIACWSGADPYEYRPLFFARLLKEVSRFRHPLGLEEIKSVLALLETPPVAWSSGVLTGSWAAEPGEFLLHLSRLLPQIPDGWVMPLVRDAFEHRSGQVLYEILARLAPRLALMPRESLLNAWREMLRAISLQPRPEFLARLVLLLPVMQILAGPKGIPEVAKAIQDLRHWWP